MPIFSKGYGLPSELGNLVFLKIPPLRVKKCAPGNLSSWIDNLF
jgi:hypothetical protein